MSTCRGRSGTGVLEGRAAGTPLFANGAGRGPASAACYDRGIPEAIAFDTHRFIKRLTESGFTERQAETLAEEHAALLDANLATKADAAEIKADVAAFKAELLKWMIGGLIAQGGLIVALVKLL